MAISNVDGKFYAINNTCLHRGGPLGQGELRAKSSPARGTTGNTTSQTGKWWLIPTVGVACYRVEVRGEEFGWMSAN